MKAVKTIIKTSLVASVIFTTFCISESYSQIRPFRQEVTPSRDSCDTVIKNVEARVKNDNYMTVEFIGKDIPNEWQQGARGRSTQLMIIMGRLREGSQQRVKNVLASPRMLTEMSKQLIDSCNNVAVVTFGMNNSGATRTFGSIGGVVREFEYVEQNRSNPRKLRWGVDWSL